MSLLAGMMPKHTMGPNISLRYYQKEGVDATKKAWAEGKRRVLLVQPTGSGKRPLGEWLMWEEIQGGHRCLVVCDRRKLVLQWAKGMERDFGVVTSIEMGAMGSDDSLVVCASRDTLTNRIASGKFHPEEFSLLVFDEAHLALGEGFQKIAKHFNLAKIVGLTATPRRSDQKDLLTFFEVMASDVKLPKLIKDGFLSPLARNHVPIRIDVGKTNKKDFTDAEVGHVIEPYLRSCAQQFANHSEGRCGLCFLPLISTSISFTNHLKDCGLRASHVDGTMDEKEVAQIMCDLCMGDLDVVCNSMLLSVGVDFPPVDLLMILRFTKSWTLYVQMVGRITRLFDPLIHLIECPDGVYRPSRRPKKGNALILDPLWLCDEHNIIQRPEVLFAKDDEELKAMMDKKNKGGGEEEDLLSCHESVVQDREETLRKKLEAVQKRKERYVQPQDFFLNIGRQDLAEYEPLVRHEMGGMTQGQIDVLINNQISLYDADGKKLKFGMAKMMIEQIQDRSHKGLATIRQAKYAQSLGMVNSYFLPKERVHQYIEQNKQHSVN